MEGDTHWKILCASTVVWSEGNDCFAVKMDLLFRIRSDYALLIWSRVWGIMKKIALRSMMGQSILPPPA